MNRYVDVLLIEDSSIDAEMAIRALKKSNLANQLLHLKNGDDALDFLFAEGAYKGRQANRMPKIILLDMKMPKMNGKEVLKKIKSDPRTNMIPVVIFSAHREDPEIKECYALGANAYVVKPLEFNDFYNVISNIGFYWMIVNEAPV